MKLLYSKTSPYARKVRMLIIELGLVENITDVIVNPYDNNTDLIKANPLGKVPVLVLDNNQSLFNSPLICQYLNNINPKKSLIADENQWETYRWEALADGMTDASYNLVMEQLHRPLNEQSSKWIKKWTHEIQYVLDYLEEHINKLGTELTLAHLAIASAIGYIDFRLAFILHEKKNTTVGLYPKLTQWYEQFSKKACMQATSPQ